jgi:WD40 repeat protein
VRDREGGMDKASGVRCMAIQQESDRPYLAVGRNNGVASIHDGLSLTRLTFLKGSKPEDAVAAVSWTPQGHTLFVSHASGIVTTFGSKQSSASNDATWHETSRWHCGDSIHCCDVHPDGNRFALGGEGREIGIHDSSTGMITIWGASYQ